MYPQTVNNNIIIIYIIYMIKIKGKFFDDKKNSRIKTKLHFKFLKTSEQTTKILRYLPTYVSL